MPDGGNPTWFKQQSAPKPLMLPMPAPGAATPLLTGLRISELPAATQANQTDMLEASQTDEPGVLVSRSVTVAQLLAGMASQAWTINYVQSQSYVTFNDLAAGQGLDLLFTSGKFTYQVQNSGVTPGPYGSPFQVPVFTVDAMGRITTASSVTVSAVQSVTATNPTIVVTGTPTNPTIAVAAQNPNPGTWGDNANVPRIIVTNTGQIIGASNVPISITNIGGLPIGGGQLTGPLGIGTFNSAWQLAILATGINTFPMAINNHDSTATIFFIGEATDKRGFLSLNTGNNLGGANLDAIGSLTLTGTGTGNTGISANQNDPSAARPVIIFEKQGTASGQMSCDGSTIGVNYFEAYGSNAAHQFYENGSLVSVFWPGGQTLYQPLSMLATISMGTQSIQFGSPADITIRRVAATQLQFLNGAGSAGTCLDFSANGIFAIKNVTGTADGVGTCATQVMNTNNIRIATCGFVMQELMGTGGVPGTFATLPASPIRGQRAFITDCTVSTFYSPAAGGGAISVPVFYDGAAWRVG